MELDVTVKNDGGNRIHVVVDGKRYVGVWAGQDVIWPQDKSISIYSTMREATLNMDLDLYPRKQP